MTKTVSRLPYSAFSASLRGILFLLLASAAAAKEPPAPPGTPPGYAIATAHPAATQAAAEILDAGGNAFDAAVAASAALSVVEPQSSGIGGGGFYLVHRAADGFETMVDARETAPAAATRDMFLDPRGAAIPKASLEGPRAAGIPGTPAAWVHFAQKLGTQPLARQLAPAIRLAREGFAVNDKQARQLAERSGHLSPAAAAVFKPGGQPPQAGTVIRQPDLAATLERIARDGRKGFYEGPLAEQLVSGVQQAGGIWVEEDLRRYRVVERKPLRFHFRDYRIVTAPPPSAGGVALQQALTMLEARGWPPADPVRTKHELAEALRRAFRDRLLLGDPDFVTMPLYRLLSREYLLPLAGTIDRARATPSETLAPAPEGANTTHFSILDAAGNRVAATQTVNTEFGSGFMIAGTGVLLNNEMDDFAASVTASNVYGLAGSAANAIAPGKRPLSSMAPAFVEGPRGLLILGSKGGSRIVSQVLRGILGFIHGMSALDVVSLPRYHHQYLPDEIQYEPAALTADDQRGLNALGHRLKVVPDGFGNMQAVWWDRAGDRLEAAADPRGVGTGQVKRTKKGSDDFSPGT
jgi:gamma-glutamyltranspeptidase/glutathione hydrolase